jgi:hypothetical protein
LRVLLRTQWNVPKAYPKSPGLTRDKSRFIK